MQGLMQSPFFPLLLMLPIFYLLIIKPKQKEIKNMEIMLNNLKKGDEVLTSAGIIGTVSQITGERIQLKVLEGARLEMTKASVIKILTSN
jgi:preprotein translocase subunit YajC